MSKKLNQNLKNILLLLKDGFYPKKIAELLRVPPTTMYDWIKQLEKKEFIEFENRSAYNKYKVKQNTISLAMSDMAGEQVRILRYHHQAFKLPIILDAKIPGKKVELNNNVQFWGEILGFRINKTSKNLIVFPLMDYTLSPKKAVFNAKKDVFRVVDYLEKKFGLVVDRNFMVESRSAHFGTGKNALAEKLLENKGFLSSELVDVDKSPPECKPEIDIKKDLDIAEAFVSQGKHFKDLGVKVDQLTMLVRSGITQQQQIQQFVSLIVKLNERILNLEKKEKK